MNRIILPKRAISETLAPLYVWFKLGYADISLPMAIVSAGGVVILLLKSWGVEHLDKREALALIYRTVELAEQVVIFTPRGFMQQDDGEWNTHRSGWEPKDFKGNWKIRIFRGFHTVDFTGKKLCQPNDAILAVHTKMGIV